MTSPMMIEPNTSTMIVRYSIDTSYRAPGSTTTAPRGNGSAGESASAMALSASTRWTTAPQID